MGKALFANQSKVPANVPKHALQKEGRSSILGDLGMLSFPRLTFKGSRFHLVKGETDKALKEVELDVIIVGAYEKVSRLYFATGYKAGAKELPACASADGEVPLPGVPEPQSETCATCPQNAKGSAVGDDGAKRKACAYLKRMVVLLADHIDLGPFIMDVKGGGLFGKSYPDQGLYNLKAYSDLLIENNTRPEAVITQLSFDAGESVPKLLFQAIGYVDENVFVDVVEPLIEGGSLEPMIDMTQVRFESPGDAEGESAFKKKLLEEAEDDEDEGEEEEEEEPTPKKKASKKKAGKKTAKKAKAKKKFCPDCGGDISDDPDHDCSDEDEEEEETEEESADDEELETEFDKELEGLANEWGDEDGEEE